MPWVIVVSKICLEWEQDLKMYQHGNLPVRILFTSKKNPWEFTSKNIDRLFINTGLREKFKQKSA